MAISIARLHLDHGNPETLHHNVPAINPLSDRMAVLVREVTRELRRRPNIYLAERGELRAARAVLIQKPDCRYCPQRKWHAR
jgi:hypothetical protein